eukprot:EG_transcript_3878
MELPPPEWRSLVPAAAEHLEFLACVARHRPLGNPRCLPAVVARYERLWLPMMAEMQREGDFRDAAPLELAWVWHCHTLDPVGYNKYCQTTFGRLLRRTCPWPSVAQYAAMGGRWREAYPKEPFELFATQPSDVSRESKGPVYPTLLPLSDEPQPPALEGVSELGRFLLETVQRQWGFLYQVSRPYFSGTPFLNDALLRYYNFLLLKKRDRSAFIAPTYDIDIIWHTHMGRPQQYAKDMQQLLGHLFSHDDSVADRTEGSRLSQAAEDTGQRWERAYRQPYMLAGAMFRGDAPPPLPSPADLQTFLGKSLSGVWRHTIAGVSATLAEPAARGCGVTLKCTGKKAVWELSPTGTDGLQQVSMQLSSTRPDTERLPLTVKLWRRSALRVKRTLGVAEVPLQPVPGPTAGPHPIAVKLDTHAVRLERHIVFEPSDWQFQLRPQPFQPIDVAAPAPLAKLLEGSGLRPVQPLTLPLAVRMPGGQLRAPGAVKAEAALHHVFAAPVRPSEAFPAVPALWCLAIHSHDEGTGAHATHLQLLDVAGRVLGVARSSATMEWPVAAKAEAWGTPLLGLAPEDSAVVVGFAGEDWALVRGRWAGLQLGVPVGKGKRRTKDAQRGKLELQLVPLPGLQRMGGPPAGYVFRDAVKDTWHLYGEGGKVLFSIFGTGPKVFIPHHVGVDQALPLLLTALGVALLRRVCHAEAAQRAVQALPPDQQSRLREFSQPGPYSPVGDFVGGSLPYSFWEPIVVTASCGGCCNFGGCGGGAGGCGGGAAGCSGGGGGCSGGGGCGG